MKNGWVDGAMDTHDALRPICSNNVARRNFLPALEHYHYLVFYAVIRTLCSFHPNDLPLPASPHIYTLLPQRCHKHPLCHILRYNIHVRKFGVWLEASVVVEREKG